MDETLVPLHLAGVIRAEQTHLRIPSRPEWIGPTAEFLRRKAVLCGACLEARSDRLLVALHEAISNAVVHGNLEVSSGLKECDDRSFAAALAARVADPRYASRAVDIEVVYNGRCCEWILTQEGPGFDVEQVLARQVPPDSDGARPSGRGLMMMRAFVDEVRYACSGRQVTLLLHKAHPEERRQDVRRPLRGRVHVAPVRPDGSVDWDAAHDAVARNASAGGLSLLQSRPEAAERVLLEVVSEGQKLYLPAEVCHCRAVGEHEVELGCRFRLEPEGPAPGAAVVTAAGLEEAVTALVERSARRGAAGQEHRAHPRFVYTERITVLAAPGAEPVTGYARDVSKGGISFIATAPVAPGVRVLELPHSKGRTPLRVRAQVLRCDRITDGFHDVAARFLCLER
jgi:anti-sigma regulatory factor (Ser/Thr protein kinase)